MPQIRPVFFFYKKKIRPVSEAMRAVLASYTLDAILEPAADEVIDPWFLRSRLDQPVVRRSTSALLALLYRYSPSSSAPFVL